MQPQFQPPANGYDAILKCPKCDNEYLHQGRIEIFDRNEDAGGLHVTVDGGKVQADSDMTGNPSIRRHGLKIEFRCEGCGARPVLSFSQHKGNTEVDFD